METKTIIAVNRFGLGARPGELVGIDGRAQAWLLDQLGGPSRVPPQLAGLPKTPEILPQVEKAVMEKKQAVKAAADENAAEPGRRGSRDRDEGGERSPVRRHYVQQAEAHLGIATSTDVPFHERLVNFWANHFTVSADQPPVAALAGAFINEAIRPNISGTFGELLLAAESHPAMIIYLDNQRSVGPQSEVARRLASRARSGRQLGINENLAREILELHTLGVDGGYSQRDVTEFARVLTGWSVGGSGPKGRLNEGKAGEFEFRENLHEPGRKMVLGRSYPQSGESQARAVLNDLAGHEATARHLSTSLAKHFVADQPPAALVEKLTQVWLQTSGSLPAVYEALVEAEESWVDVQSKFKSPQDYLVSTFRGFGRTGKTRHLIRGMQQLGQELFRPGSPAGWPDTAQSWGGADALYKRIEWATAVASVVGNRANPLTLADQWLSDGLGAHSRQAISRAESVEQGLTLLLVSPEFQRR